MIIYRFSHNFEGLLVIMWVPLLSRHKLLFTVVLQKTLRCKVLYVLQVFLQDSLSFLLNRIIFKLFAFLPVNFSFLLLFLFLTILFKSLLP